MLLSLILIYYVIYLQYLSGRGGGYIGLHDMELCSFKADISWVDVRNMNQWAPMFHIRIRMDPHSFVQVSCPNSIGQIRVVFGGDPGPPVFDPGPLFSGSGFTTWQKIDLKKN